MFAKSYISYFSKITVSVIKQANIGYMRLHFLDPLRDFGYGNKGKYFKDNFEEQDVFILMNREIGRLFQGNQGTETP